jgi:hypothetical protein
MTLSDAIKERNITEVVHFTTNAGLLGILASKAILPNTQLREEQTLSFIFEQNSAVRKERDREWLNYVNLSITKPNYDFLSYSKYRRQDQDIFWVLLSISPEILEHDGVYFTTTNNIYPSCTRGNDQAAFENMFSNSFFGKFQRKVTRIPSTPANQTTCEQAEVLYPGAIPLSYVKKIYVCCDEDRFSVAGQQLSLSTKIDIIVDPSIFER